MRHRPLVLLVLASVLLLAVGPAPLSAQVPTISGSLPASGGVGLGVWSGGTLIEVSTAATARGCNLGAVWLIPGGKFVRYVFGAPTVVNTEFLTAFPSPLAASTPLIFICRAPTAPTAVPPVAAALPGDATDRELERLEFAGLNVERTSRGLHALAPSSILSAAAIKYAAFHLGAGLPLSHNADGRQQWERAQAEGYPPDSASEIIAYYESTQLMTPAQLGPIFVKQWMDSPPHRAIVLGQAFDSSELGMGCAHGKGRTGLNIVFCVGVAGRP